MLEKLPHALGAALQGIRPGLGRIVAAGGDFADVPDTIRVSSPAFTEGAPIPAPYTEDGDAISPPLAWAGVPAGARSVVLVIEDADSPTPAPLVHALVWSLPGQDGELAEAALPSEAGPGDERQMGRNSFFGAEYLAPDPPPGHGPHRYAVQAFALDTELTFEGPPGRGALVDAMRGHVVAKGVLVGIYERE